MTRETTCPACLNAITFNDRRAGESVACPHCKAAMRLPEIQPEQSPPITLEYATGAAPTRGSSVGPAFIVLAFVAGLCLAIGLLIAVTGGKSIAAGACYAMFWVVLAVALIFGLAGGFMWPIRVAYRRQHPHREAIEIAALCGLLFLPFWLGACVWAHMTPEGGQSSE